MLPLHPSTAVRLFIMRACSKAHSKHKLPCNSKAFSQKLQHIRLLLVLEDSTFDATSSFQIFVFLFRTCSTSLTSKCIYCLCQFQLRVWNCMWALHKELFTKLAVAPHISQFALKKKLEFSIAYNNISKK